MLLSRNIPLKAEKGPGNRLLSFSPISVIDVGDLSAGSQDPECRGGVGTFSCSPICLALQESWKHKAFNQTFLVFI